MTAIALTSTLEHGSWVDTIPEEPEYYTQEIASQVSREVNYVLKIEDFKGERLVTSLYDLPLTRKQTFRREREKTQLQIVFALNLLIASSVLLKVTHYAVLLVLLSTSLFLRRLAHFTTVLLLKQADNYGAER